MSTHVTMRVTAGMAAMAAMAMAMTAMTAMTATTGGCGGAERPGATAEGGSSPDAQPHVDGRDAAAAAIAPPCELPSGAAASESVHLQPLRPGVAMGGAIPEHWLVEREEAIGGVRAIVRYVATYNNPLGESGAEERGAIELRSDGRIAAVVRTEGYAEFE